MGVTAPRHTAYFNSKKLLSAYAGVTFKLNVLKIGTIVYLTGTNHLAFEENSDFIEGQRCPKKTDFGPKKGHFWLLNHP